MVYIYTKIDEVMIGRIQQKHADFPELKKHALAKALKVSRTSIDKALGYDSSRKAKKARKRYTRRPPAPSVKKRRELVKKLAQETRVIKGITYLKQASAPAIAAALKDRYQIDVSPVTVWRDTVNVGLVCRVRTKVPTRDPEVIAKRYKFLKQMKKQGKRWCETILFSDEHVQAAMEFGDRTQYVKKGHSTLGRHSASPKNVPCFQVWGCIGLNFKSQLIFFPKLNKPTDEDAWENKSGTGWRLNSRRYIDNCLSPLIKDLKEKKMEDKVVFMQDGARCHVSKETMTYLEQNKRIAVLHEWPPYSPDLNPIEHLWASMKKRVADQKPSTDQELKRAMRKFWDDLTHDEINEYIHGYWRKVQRGLQNEGKPLTRKFRA